MNKISYAIKMDSSIVRQIREFCVSHGLKQGYFVEKALREQLDKEETNEDIKDFRTLRTQEDTAISFDNYLKRRKN